MLLKKHSFHKNNAFIRNVIKFVPDVIFLFCLHLQQANTLQVFLVLYHIFLQWTAHTSVWASKVEQKIKNRRTIEYNGNNMKNRKFYTFMICLKRMYQFMHLGQIFRKLINAFKNHSSFFFLQVSIGNTGNSTFTGYKMAIIFVGLTSSSWNLVEVCNIKLCLHILKLSWLVALFRKLFRKKQEGGRMPPPVLFRVKLKLTFSAQKINWYMA